MKKVLSLSYFIFLFMLGSCKKDNEVTPDPNSPQELIKGIWLNTKYHYKLFDNGQHYDEDTDTRNDLVEFDGTKVYSLDAGNKIEIGSYKIYTDAGKSFIELTASTSKTNIEIIKLTKTDMTYLIRGEDHLNGKHLQSEEYHEFIRQ